MALSCLFLQTMVSARLFNCWSCNLCDHVKRSHDIFVQCLPKSAPSANICIVLLLWSSKTKQWQGIKIYDHRSYAIFIWCLNFVRNDPTSVGQDIENAVYPKNRSLLVGFLVSDWKCVFFTISGRLVLWFVSHLLTANWLLSI